MNDMVFLVFIVISLTKNIFPVCYSLRSQLNTLQEASGGKRLSVNDLVIKVWCLDLLYYSMCDYVLYLGSVKG